MKRPLASVIGILVGLTALSALAFLWPSPESTSGTAVAFLGNPFLASERWLDAMILVTMFAVGTMLPASEVAQVGRRWPTVLGGTAVQYTVMPLLAFLTGRLWGLDGGLLLGIALVGCVPGAMASNVLTWNAGGNTSYSVSLTTTATLLSPLMVPLMLWLLVARQVSPAVIGATAVKLTCIVVVPVILGHLARRSHRAVELWATRLGPPLANVVILWIIAVVVAKTRANPDLSRAASTVWPPLLAINLGGYAAGYLGGRMMRLPESMRRALTLEVGMQNAGLGAVLAIGTLHEDLAAVPTAIYTFGCMLTGTVLACAWAAIGTVEEGSEKDEWGTDD